jgi:hypothetical protein
MVKTEPTTYTPIWTPNRQYRLICTANYDCEQVNFITFNLTKTKKINIARIREGLTGSNLPVLSPGPEHLRRRWCGDLQLEGHRRRGDLLQLEGHCRHGGRGCRTCDLRPHQLRYESNLKLHYFLRFLWWSNKFISMSRRLWTHSVA